MATGEGSTTEPWGSTVRVRKGVITSLRIEKGWRLEDLARKAICSIGTVTNCERGKRVHVTTLAKIAKALGAEIRNLVENGDESRAEASPPGPFIELTMKLIVPFERFDETSDLFVFLQGLTQKYNPHGQIVVQNVERSSVTVALGLTATEDLMSLVRLFCGLEFNDLAVAAVSFHSYQNDVDDLTDGLWKGAVDNSTGQLMVPIPIPPLNISFTYPNINWVGPSDSYRTRHGLRSGIAGLKSNPSGANRIWTKYNGKRGGVYFEIGYRPDNDLWTLQSHLDSGTDNIIPKLRDLMRGGAKDDIEE